MSMKKTEQIGPNQYSVTFDASREAFDEAIAKVFKKASKNISIPGFRRGKAPRAIVEKMYGKEVFYEDAVNEILPEAYEDAVKDFEREIVSRPEFDIDTIDENGVVMVAKFYTKPDVEIKDYLGIPVTRDRIEVSDDDINGEIDRIRQRNSRLIEVTDRPAAMGDIVKIDFVGKMDGVPFEGGSMEGHELKLGSGQFIPGFEDQIAGHSLGEEFDINVNFPEDYHMSDIAGKPAVFSCKINEIKFNELPEVDDDFARDVSEFDTLDEYKADIKAKLTEKKNKEADTKVEAELMTALAEKLEGDIPEAMFDREIENYIRDYDSRLRTQGLDLSTYFKYTGLSLDTLRAQMRPEAERQVKMRLALDKIAELEKIEISDEELKEEYVRLSKVYDTDTEKVEQMVDAKPLSEDMKVRKAIDLVKNSAVVTEKSEDEADAAEEAPEKKAPAKKSSAKKAADGSTEKKTTRKSTAKKSAAKKEADVSEAEAAGKDENAENAESAEGGDGKAE